MLDEPTKYELELEAEIERLREALEQIARANPADNVTGVWLQRFAQSALEGSSDE